MKGLIINEYQKTLKQTSYRVLLIIFAVVLIATPLLNLVSEKLFEGDRTAKEIYESHLDTAEFYKMMDDELEERFWLDNASSAKFFIENSLEDWKASYLLTGAVISFLPDFGSEERSGYTYSDYHLRARAYEILIEGKFSDAELYNSSYWYYLIEYFESDGVYFDGSEWIDEDGNAAEKPLTDAQIKDLSDEAKRELEELSTLVIDCTAEKVLKQYSAYAQSLKSLSEIELARLNASGADQGEIFAAQRRLEINSLASEMFDKLESEIDTLDDWRFDFCVSFLYAEQIHSAFCAYPVSEKTFADNKAQEFYLYETYSDYVEELEKGRSDAEAGIRVAHYAVMNNVAPEGVESKTKYNIRSEIISVSGFATVFSIVLAGMIVANEFTSGTVRLLLIRPKKRWKILLSKLTCALSLYVLLVLISIAVLSVIEILIHGVGDAFTPDLSYSGGKVVEIPAMVETLYTAALAIIQSLPFIMLAFLLSVLMKKSALALVVTFVAYSMSATVQTVALLLTSEIGFLEYTILPYLSLESFRFSASDIAIQNMTYDIFDLDMLFGSITPSLSSFSAPLGIALVLIHAIALGALSFISFKKQQIK
ncbi:MAG: ABC transporter permease [Clostridia bacterium]|nr:ABC transporter permease [Clostridia bacterium]